ncbi:MAG: hypothetical protein ACREJM_07980, partial [Candidatus Saccharimonadales bacterium]
RVPAAQQQRYAGRIFSPCRRLKMTKSEKQKPEPCYLCKEQVTKGRYDEPHPFLRLTYASQPIGTGLAAVSIIITRTIFAVRSFLIQPIITTSVGLSSVMNLPKVTV